MSALGSWLWGTSQLDDAIDKATSELVPAGSEDMALNLEICDQIRSKSVSARDAMRALKRRLNHKNPNVQLLALSLTDVCVKNGGDQFLAEIASREFMDNLVSILNMPALNVDVKNNILKHVQNWSFAFDGKPTLGYVGQVYKTLKTEGFKFPPRDHVFTSSAIVDTQTAPEWVDSDVCLRCRTAFTFTNRKHHCRNCGLVFDQQCSSKSMALPHFGITQEVRVCDGCYNKLLKKVDKSRGSERLHRRSTGGHSSRHRSGRDLDDAELQRAIQLSLQEADGAGGPARPGYVPSQPTYVSEPPIVSSTRRPSRVRYGQGEGMEEDDPDLRAAIEASLREANAPRPSAPVAPDVLRPPSSSTVRGQAPPEIASLPPAPSLPNYDLDLTESDAILTFNQTIEQVQAQGGKDMSRYPHVNELYEKANGLRPKLALSLDDTGRKEQMLTDMNEKLSQAVKLYDKLLTEQVSHPTWRQQQQQQPTPTVSTHQQTAQYMPGYQTLNGYVPAAAQPYQQAAPFSPRSSVMSPPPLAQAPHAPTATAAAPAPVLPTPFVGTHVQEASYTHAQPQANVPVQPQWYPSQPQQRSEQPQVISPPPTQQQQQQPQPQPQPQQLGQAPPQTLYSPLQQQQQQQAQRQFTIPVATPAQSNLQQEQLQRQFSMSPQVMASAQSVQPVQFATPQQPDPSQLTVQHAPPAGIPQQALQFAQLQTSHIPVPTAPPPPPPQQQEVGAPPQVAKPVPIVSHIPQEPHPTTRAGTYALPGSASLSRHHTITAPATPLPQFPIAPTSAPMQAWPSVPTPQSERKEALLIDL